MIFSTIKNFFHLPSSFSPRARRTVTWSNILTASRDCDWTEEELAGAHLEPGRVKRMAAANYAAVDNILDILEPLIRRRAELSDGLRRELEHDDMDVGYETFLVARFPNVSEALIFALRCRRELRAGAEQRRAARRAVQSAQELSCDLDGQYWSAPLPSRRSRRQPVRYSTAA